jgi:hypothetical protein
MNWNKPSHGDYAPGWILNVILLAVIVLVVACLFYQSL